MSITANNPEGDIVIAFDLVDDDRRKNYYMCRLCNAEMLLVLPRTNIVNHFRHIAKTGCKGSKESIEHLMAKKYFYDLYKNDPAYNKVEIEEHCGDRIGDVVLHPVDDKVLCTDIEVQKSDIAPSEIDSRFKDWNASGHDIMWIIINSSLNNSMNHSMVGIPQWIVHIHDTTGKLCLYQDGSLYEVKLLKTYKHIPEPFNAPKARNHWTENTLMRWIRIRKIDDVEINHNTHSNIYGNDVCVAEYKQVEEREEVIV